jgi:hypothetical protein
MWRDIKQRKRIEDYPQNSPEYLQMLQLGMVAERKELLQANVCDVIGVRVYRAEFVPKTDSNGWSDPFVRLHYGALMKEGYTHHLLCPSVSCA